MVGNLDHAVFYDPIHHPDVFGESSAAGLVARGNPDFLISRALREDFALAVVTLAARDVMEDHHALADLETGDSFTYGGDVTCDLVSEDAGSGMRAGGDLFQIGATDAAGVHADEKLAQADLRNGNGFDAHVVLAVVDGSLHGGRNLVHFASRRVCGYRHLARHLCSLRDSGIFFGMHSDLLLQTLAKNMRGTPAVSCEPPNSRPDPRTDKAI